MNIEDQDQIEIDPELVSLRKAPRPIGPLLVASVLILSIYLIVTLRADLVYWLRSRSPRSLGDAVALVNRPARLNDFVSIRAVPDRSAPARLRVSQHPGYRIMPVLGTSRHLWLQVPGDARGEAPTYDEVYQGRLRRLSDAKYVRALGEHLARQAPLPRFVAPKSILAGSTARLKDLAGDELEVSADSRIEMDQLVTGVMRVTVIKSDQIGDDTAARAALANAGITILDAAASSGPSMWIYEVADPGETALEEALVKNHLLNAFVEETIVRLGGTWKELAADPSTHSLMLSGRRLPISSIRRLGVYVKPTLPADALLLQDGDEPSGYWYIPLLFGLLLVSSTTLVWAWIRRNRNSRERE